MSDRLSAKQSLYVFKKLSNLRLSVIVSCEAVISSVRDGEGVPFDRLNWWSRLADRSEACDAELSVLHRAEAANTAR